VKSGLGRSSTPETESQRGHQLGQEESTVCQLRVGWIGKQLDKNKEIEKENNVTSTIPAFGLTLSIHKLNSQHPSPVDC